MVRLHLNPHFSLLCLWFYCLRLTDNTHSALSYFYCICSFVSLKDKVYSFLLLFSWYTRSLLTYVNFSGSTSKCLRFMNLNFSSHLFKHWEQVVIIKTSFCLFFFLSYFCLPVEIYASFIFLSPWFYCGLIPFDTTTLQCSIFTVWYAKHKHMTDVVNLPNLIWEKKLGRLS